MKKLITTLTLTAGFAAVPLLAQDAPPPAATPAAPGTPRLLPAPEAPGTPRPVPAPEDPPAEVPDSFKSEKDRQSYALGTHFATREKSNASINGNPLPNAGEIVAGVKDVLSGGKSLDYAIGAQIGMSIRRLEVDVDIEILAQAVSEVMASQPLMLTAPQQQQVIQRVSTQFNERSATKRREEGAKALKAAEEFIAANAKAEGVKQTASGLQYRIEKEGDGKSPVIDDLVTMNYKGTLADGTVFEKSPDASPARKPVKGLAKGLQEGLALIKTGSKAKFWVPPALGYGENGRPPLVKANAVLTYEVELLGVELLPKQPVGATGTSPARQPITAVTPPITVEIPPKPGEKPAEAPKAPEAPKPPAPPATPVPPAKE